MKCLYLMLLCAFVFPIITNAQDMSSRFRRKNFKFTQRDLSVIVAEDGFYPNHLVAFKGEKIRLFITSSSKKDSCFVLQKHEVFIAAEISVVNEAEFVADQSGRFRFYCPSSDFEGFLTVFEKDKPKEEVDRSIASEKPKYWTPRDND